MIVGSDAKVSSFDHVSASEAGLPTMAVDTPPPAPDDSSPIMLPYPYSDQSTGDPLNYPNGGGLRLNNPANVNTSVEYDPATGQYNINQKMGNMDYRPPTYMDSEEYQDYMFRKQTKSYWSQREHAESANSKQNAVIPKLRVGGEIFDRIFGGNTVDIRPNGSAELIFAYQGTNTQNPALPEKQRKISTFDFDEKIQLNVVGKIGDKLKLTTSYNTEATFDYENQMKLEYTGYEDEIIKKIEAGNVSMPLNGTLITGSQTLFGVKTQLQFGRLTVTSILSQQKGKKSEVDVTGGAQVTKYEIAGDAYESNKHFFLAQYFRDHFNSALAGLPFVNSQVNINRIEVWVSNTTGATNDVRDADMFSDLAEDGTHLVAPSNAYIHDINIANDLPDNNQNDLYQNMNLLGTPPGGGASTTGVGTRNRTTSANTIQTASGGTMLSSVNYLTGQMRKLQPSEYTLNATLGFISLNQQLNPEQVLAVAYQYTYQGQTYTVGEFSDGGVSAPQSLFLKMLKADAPNTRFPIWNLMMKNVYAIGAYQVSSKDFQLNVFYTNAATGTDINYLPVTDEPAITSKPLIQVLNLDRLNKQNDQVPDGVFDYVDGVTINSNNGRVIFPVVEPFGDFLRSKFVVNPTEANHYVFDQLYDSTRVSAQQSGLAVNRFKIKGQYQSASGSDISLGAPNIPQGSVTVTAGGVQLTENVDYTVDYTLGHLKIINEGILNSGTPIKISLESNALFAIQSKTLFGTHLDYKINKDFNIGATIMNLTERPLTKKVNIGDEPVSNTIWGLDGNYRTDAPFLTRLVDKIPLINTKEMSTITAAGEFAYLIPGHSKAIGKDGNSYIDDFEGSQSTIDMRTQGAWSIASTPQGQRALFPEADSVNSLAFGYNRAKLCWYVIDNILLRRQNTTPGYYSNADLSNNFTREIPETEVFPNKQSPTGQTANIATLDLAYYPSERGPYNYNVDSTASFGGLSPTGQLNNPKSRWGGIMRAITTNDFEAANIEFIQFWVMDPFNADNPTANWNTSGELYFNLGSVSEDVLHDGYKAAENVLPAPSTASQNSGMNLPTDTTIWGRVPLVQPLVNAFNSDPGDRASQDVGLDGFDDAQEAAFFSNFVNRAQAVVTDPASYAKLHADPSADDFHYFRGSDYDGAQLKTLDRYKQWNGLEQNSRTTEQSPESYPTPGPTSGTPNVEDINRDNNLSTTESYYQYHISLKPGDFAAGVGNNYITDVFTTTGQNIKDGSTKPITWYQFKIPIKVPEQRVGTIENFQSIRFMRMFFKDVDKPIVMRFARLELVRGEWRKYGYDLLSPGLYIPNDDNTTQFDIGAVNIEENGSRSPVNYVLPPGIEREISAASAALIKQNEQAMSLTVCNLKDGNSRAAYKNTELDVRSYKKMKMYIHGEASANAGDVLRSSDLHVFIRLGTDYTDNYYEYDIPLAVTPPGNYNGTNSDDQYKVWPESNEMVLEFAKLQAAKQKRNIDMAGSTAISLTSEYKVDDGNRVITIKGNPNLSDIKTIMIGVRNPKKNGPADVADDGLPKCGQVWVNELRLSDFDQSGGWASTARVTAKLADFGTVSLSGNMYTPGFGSIEDKVSARKKETLKQYDFSSSLELGKFIPQQYNVHIPMYVGYSETFITPQYNPLDPDILLAPTLKDPSIPKDQRDSIRRVTQDYTKRKSLNFTNVKKDKGKNAKKPHIYDVENFAGSYSYNEIYKRNVNIEYNSEKTYHGGLTYNYAPQPKNIKPFAKNKLFQSKYLLLVKDINFYPYPNKLGFSTDVNRDYTLSKNRNTTTDDIIILPTFSKTFNMNRNYDLKYDISKNIKLDFTATNQSRLLEPDGEITTAIRDTVRREFFDRLTNTQYNQQLNVNYTIPINKLPLLDFTTASVRYSGTYSWTHSPLYNTQKDPVTGRWIQKDSLGNTIQNSRNISWNGQLNMVTLYNKIPYLKRINQKKIGQKTATDKNGKPLPAVRPGAKPAADSTKKKDDNFEIFEYLARVVMSLKTVNITYTDNAGTILNGYKQNTQMLGMDSHFEGPTPGFAFGSQQDIRETAIRNNWLVKTPSLNTPYATTTSKNLNIRANAEPFPDLKIELTATRTESKSNSEFFRWSDVADRYVHDAPTQTGTFSMSFLSYKTSFDKTGDKTFQKFLDDRAVISQRLGGENSYSHGLVDGFADGYNATSQDVLIPAFIAAYSGKNPASTALTAFPKVPKPNWRVTYDGLSKLDKIKKYFKSFTLSHAYHSTYSVGGYASNLLYQPGQDGFTAIREQVSSIANNPNFLARNQINTITIAEQWSPLIKLEMTMNNSILLNFEYKKDRTLSLGLTSRTITELLGREIIGGIGYRIRELKLGNLKIKGKPIKSDLNLKGDLSFRKNVTVMRQIVQEVSQSTGGTNIISIKLSADYVISERINIRIFYDHIINKPVISTSFPTTNTNAGVSLRLTLSN